MMQEGVRIFRDEPPKSDFVSHMFRAFSERVFWGQRNRET
jgi:hypothetical protein